MALKQFPVQKARLQHVVCEAKVNRGLCRKAWVEIGGSVFVVLVQYCTKRFEVCEKIQVYPEIFDSKPYVCMVSFNHINL